VSGTLIAFILKKETEMKRIEAIIRPTRVGKVCTALEKAGHSRILFSQIENHDTQTVIKYQLRGKTYKADLMTKARLELIVKDIEAGKIVKAIRDAAFTGDVGDGKIFVHAMEDAIRIGTGGRGDAAI
jgi:nitrogen regulatory protein PII